MKILVIENQDLAADLRRAMEGRAASIGSLNGPDTLAHEVARQQPDLIVIDEGISIGSFTFIPTQKTLKAGDTAIHLKPMQCKLLLLLSVSMSLTVSREQIERMLWDNDLCHEYSINNFISQLRKILASDPSVAIETVSGAGYRLCKR